ncbi:MAG TPA: MerR family transcriptional regulator [Puia sp.]|nr:MerR family transcriptional regulator [Puia sp.]
MNAFTIRDIENMCGIRAHTLRAWERRYQLRIPKRKAGNHRLYDNDDLKYFLRIAFLYHNGHKISQLAQLDEKEIGRLALKVPQPGRANDIFINHLIEASLDFDQELFDRILHNIILHMGFEKAITQVVYPFLQKIGLLWLTGNVVPAQEHFASALITRKLLVAINSLENPRPAPGQELTERSGDLPGSRSSSGSDVPPRRHILLFTPKGEFHEIPLLYMRYLLKKNGQSTVYFGKNVCLEDLHYYCSQKEVTDLYFHLVTHLLRCEPEQYIKKMSESFPDQQIIISGNIGAGVYTTDPRVRLLKTPEEMQEFAKGN